MHCTNVRGVFFGLTLACASLCLSSGGRAATYVWNKATGTQTFNLAANWDDGTTGFPNAVDDIAEMSTLDVTATQTINVTQPITLGELRTGDTTSTFRARTFNGAGSLKFQVSSGTAKVKYGFGGLMNVSSTINLPIELASNTEFVMDLNSSTSRNLYLGTGALTGSGDMIINAATRGIVAIFTDTYDLSNYTGTFKYTSNGGGNMFQLAGNAGGVPRNARLATLEMSVATAGGSVWIFDGVAGSSLELGALRGDGVIKPFAFAGTLRTGYLAGTNNFAGSLEEVGRFGAGGLSYEKAGADSTQIFSGTNLYAGTTTVSAGTLLINGTNSGGGACTVASGAILGGTGSLGTSPVTVAAGGFLAPGASIESLDVGAATINGTLAIEYQGALGAGNDSIDLLNVGGALDITNATVDFSSLGGVVDDAALVFAKYSSLTGTQFASVTGLLPLNYAIDYAYNDGSSTNNIALVQVPEPCAFVLAGLGCSLMLIIPRRRKQGCFADTDRRGEIG
jgi:fibronectin-binding autotransporter adhesin